MIILTFDENLLSLFKKMNALDFFIQAASRLISYLECNFVIDTQLTSVLTKLPDADINQIDIMVMQHRAQEQLYLKLKEYLNVLKQTAKPVCPFKQAINIHIYAIKSIDTQFFIEVVKEHQEALAAVSGVPLPNNVQNSDEAIESVSRFFPFDIILPLMQDQTFITNLAKIVIEFTPSNFTKTIKNIFNLMKPVQLNPLSKIVVSEMLLDYFVGENKLSDKRTVFKNYLVTDVQFLQNCKLIISGGIASLGIDPEKSKLFEYDFPETKENKNPIQYEPPMSLSLCFDDTGLEMPLNKLTHVWILLRKIPVAFSTTSSFFIISQAIDWLKAAMTKEGMSVGADELFQFFVACLVNAKLLHLPTFIKLIDNFAVDDLMSSRSKYIKQQLISAVEFIQTRQIRVPPFIVFPFEKTDNPAFEKVDNGHIILPRFTVFSFPRFVGGAVGSVLVYTGLQTDTAIGYRYKINEKGTDLLLRLDRDFMTIPTTDGTIFTLDIHEAEDRRLIHIPDGDMANHEADAALISNLILMVPNQVKYPSLKIKDNLLKQFSDAWRINYDDAQRLAFTLVTTLQSALIKKGYTKVVETGVISEIDVHYLKSLIPGFKNEFYINQKIFAFVTR